MFNSLRNNIPKRGYGEIIEGDEENSIKIEEAANSLTLERGRMWKGERGGIRKREMGMGERGRGREKDRGSGEPEKTKKYYQ